MRRSPGEKRDAGPQAFAVSFTSTTVVSRQFKFFLISHLEEISLSHQTSMSTLANASITPFNLRAGGLLLLTTLGLASLWLLSSSRSSGVQTTPFRPGSIIHIVLFSYTPSTSDSEKSDIADAFVGLKDRCTRDGKSYILDIEGGSNGSPEEAGQEYEVSLYPCYIRES
jgi:hypothetical protein